MAAPPARARADYDYLIKLLLIGDSGLFSFRLFVLFSEKIFEDENRKFDIFRSHAFGFL